MDELQHDVTQCHCPKCIGEIEPCPNIPVIEFIGRDEFRYAIRYIKFVDRIWYVTYEAYNPKSQHYPQLALYNDSVPVHTWINWSTGKV